MPSTIIRTTVACETWRHDQCRGQVISLTYVGPCACPVCEHDQAKAA